MADYEDLCNTWGSYTLPDGARCSLNVKGRSLIDKPKANVNTVYDIFLNGLSISRKFSSSLF